MLYFLAESYGSLMIALFWSFVASVSNAKSAKRGYALIMTGAQLGSVSGPFLAWHAKSIGLPILFGVATVSILCLMLMIRYFVRLFPREQWLGTRKKTAPKKRLKTGFWEGAKLLVTKPYLFGIFLLVSFFEIVTTIVDYQMKMQAQALPEYASTEALTSFMGIFGMWTNGLAFFVALLGTGYLIRRFGVRKCLLIFPSCLGIVVLGLYIVILCGSVSPKTLLLVTLAVVIVAKGLSYALNNPVKEILYIPTSRDAKFKTKSWIDAFGARGSKAMGSTFTNILKDCPQALLFYGTILSLGFIGIWLLVAVFVGQKCHQLTKDGKIVG
jgi:AAA family ATP:ADP antiporter